jgi:hypothetical protein
MKPLWTSSSARKSRAGAARKSDNGCDRLPFAAPTFMRILCLLNRDLAGNLVLNLLLLALATPFSEFSPAEDHLPNFDPVTAVMEGSGVPMNGRPRLRAHVVD